MDSNRLSYWTDSISDIIKKTELNLLRLHKKAPPTVVWEEYSRPTTSMHIQNIALDRSLDHRIQSSRAGSSQRQETESDTGLFIAKELEGLKANLEKLIYERHSSYANEMSDVLTRLASIEVNMSSKQESVIYMQGKDLNKLLKHTENKFQSELDRIQDQLIGNVTREDLKKVQDYMRNYNTDDINRIELQCRNVHSSVDTLKHEMYKYIDDKFRSSESNAIKQSQLLNLKSEVANETEQQVNKIKESFETNLKILGNELHDMVETKLYSCEKSLADSVQNQTEDYKHIIIKLETQLNDSSYNVNQLENERDSLKKDLANLVTEISECKQNSADLSYEMQSFKLNLENLENDVESCKEGLDILQGLENDVESCKESLDKLQGLENDVESYQKGLDKLLRLENDVESCKEGLDKLQGLGNDLESCQKDLDILKGLENNVESYQKGMDKLLRLENDVESCKEGLGKLQRLGNDVESCKVSLNKLPKLENVVESCKEGLDKLQRLENDMANCKEDLTDELGKYKLKYDNLTAQMEKFKVYVGDLDTNINEYKQNLDNLQDYTKCEFQEIRDEMYKWNDRLNTSSLEKQISDIRKELLLFATNEDLTSHLVALQDRISKSIQFEDLRNLTQEISQIQLHKAQQDDRLNSYEERLIKLEPDSISNEMHKDYYASKSNPIDTSPLHKPFHNEPSFKDSLHKIQIVEKLSISQESEMSDESLEAESENCLNSESRSEEDSFRNMRYKNIEPTIDTPQDIFHVKLVEQNIQQDVIGQKSKLGPLVDFSKKGSRVMKEQSPKQDYKIQLEQTVSLDKISEPELSNSQQILKEFKSESIPKIELQSKAGFSSIESLKVATNNLDYVFSDFVPSRNESQDHSLNFDHSSSVMNSILEDDSGKEDPFNKVSSFNNRIQNFTQDNLKEVSLHKPSISIPSLDDFNDLIDSSKVPQQRFHKLSQDSEFSQFSQFSQLSKHPIEFLASSGSKSITPTYQDEELENLADYLTEALLSEELGLGLDVIEDVAYRFIEQHNPELIEGGEEMYEYEDEMSEERSDISEDY